MTRARRWCIVTGALVALIGAACSAPILANPPASRGPGPSPAPPAPGSADPQPIRFPRDDGAHDRLTEWWYYTGHLADAAGHRYGWEFVIFRAERGSYALTWASHMALTDETGRRFHYAQRSEVGPQVDLSHASAAEPAGFALRMSGADPEVPAATAADTPPAWTMAGANGRDRIDIALSQGEAAAAGLPGGLELHLDVAAGKPPALHDDDGWIDFGPAGGSYYYSRTAMTARGTLLIGNQTSEVSGSAWFDHQWGDFIAVGGGGWDWFALNLADGTDLTVSMVRAADGSTPLVYGTLVGADGTTRHLDRSAFSVRVQGHWRSPSTGADYPSGWVIDVPSEALHIELTPTVLDQELDTRATTGVAYWEGAQAVVASHHGLRLGGEAYVELTGYWP